MSFQGGRAEGRRGRIGLDAELTVLDETKMKLGGSHWKVWRSNAYEVLTY